MTRKGAALDTASRLRILEHLPVALAILDFSEVRRFSRQLSLQSADADDCLLAKVCERIRVRDVNQALREMLGPTGAGLRHNLVRELLATDIRRGLLPFLTAEKTLTRVEFETVARRESGDNIEVLVTLIAASEGHEFVLCLVSDQTEQHRLRHLAETYRTQLEYLIQARNRELAVSGSPLGDVEFNC